MKLRKKTKYEIDAYHKMHDLRKESVHVLHILQDIYKREELKKKINIIEQYQLDSQIDQTLRERGINSFQAKQQKIELKKLESFNY